MISRGRVNWFDPVKRFGFVKLESGYGDAFLHIDILKAGGFYFVPRGTEVKVVWESLNGRQRVMELLEVDVTCANAGEPPALQRRPSE